jgi:hypothetical protein
VATLAAIRTALNGEIGVVTDAEATPWSVAVRNQAISDGYGALWRAGVWKPTVQSVASVTDTWVYALTTIRRLERLELLDSSGRLLETPGGVVEDDGSGAWQLRLKASIATGSTMRVRGWAAYKSTFADDSATDDLPAEHGRLPRLKAKAIIWRIALAGFARYGERQALPPEMNMSISELFVMVAAAEREFDTEAKALANLRPRSGQTKSL